MKPAVPAADQRPDLDLTDEEVAALGGGDQVTLTRIRLRVAMGLWRRVRLERRSLEGTVAHAARDGHGLSTAVMALVDAYEDAALQRIFAFLLDTVWTGKEAM